MELLECVLGNRNDPDWRLKLEKANIDVLRLDQWEAQKNRVRKYTEGGKEVAVSLARSTHLHDGDILLWDKESQKAVVVEIQFKGVMVIHLAGLFQLSEQENLRTSIELGHALGNQHWPAVVKGTEVYVPVTVDEKVMSSVMKTHAFPGISFDFIPGAEVIPYLAPDEARRLFGGTDVLPHVHGDAGGQVHEHVHAH